MGGAGEYRTMGGGGDNLAHGGGGLAPILTLCTTAAWCACIGPWIVVGDA